MENLNTVFNKVHDTILIVDCERNENITQFLSNLITDSHKVIIYNHFSNHDNLSDANEERITFNNVVYELRFISSAWIFEGSAGNRSRRKWDGFVYSRHGGLQYTKWWKFKRSDKLAIHWDAEFDFHSQDKVVLAYVQCDKLRIDQYKRDFNTYIGGKNNIFCNKHKCPLISSTSRVNLCSKCGIKKEFYSCCHFDCKNCLCKTCVNDMNQDVPNFILESTTQKDSNNNNSNRNDYEYIDDTNSYVSLSDDGNQEGDNNRHNSICGDDCSDFSLISNRTPTHSIQNESTGNNHEGRDILCDDSISSNLIDNESCFTHDSFDDDFEDFLISTDDTELITSNSHDYIGNDVTIVPTKNAGETAFII